MKRLALVCLTLTLAALAVTYWLYNDRAEYIWQAEAYQLMKGEPERIATRGRCMELAYGLSEYEAWIRSAVYNRYSKAFAVSWETYAAVAWTESRYGRYPSSHKGARGEMQLMRNPIKEMCHKYDLPFRGNATLNDQFNNVNLGCLKLSLLITDRGDSLGITRYNGIGNEADSFYVNVCGERARLREIYKRIGR